MNTCDQTGFSNMNEILYTPNPTETGLCTGTSTGLYVGNSHSASSSEFPDVVNANIHGILNVALDDPEVGYPTTSYLLNFSKVGLCDTGPYPGSTKKNSRETMIQAVQAIDQLFAEAESQKNAKILVHCWSGGSRSVTIAALWISQRLDYTPTPGQTKFATAINMVRRCRKFGLGCPPNHSSYTPYNVNDPDFSGTPGLPYTDGKPMAALYKMAQEIDTSVCIAIGKGKPPPPYEPGTCPQSPKH